VGGREDDYTAADFDFHARGAAFDAQLAEMAAVWAGEPRGTAGAIGPAPVQPGGPPLLVGGSSEAAIRRTVEHGAGWIAGGGGAQAFAQGADAVRKAWSDAGRAGQPRLAALGYYALGPDARQLADRYLGDYYAFLGEYASQVAQSAAVTEDAVREQVTAFTEAGCDELILFPCSPDVDQVELLADVTLRSQP
jgi:alkanesulfonate monooxygenase SsuD/methylene tetrahydromethanopterin reductase-like flavin-dependent oxidoreductase (luciferase family)